MRVDPIKHILKAPGTEHLKLEYCEPLSNSAFKFNLRRYTAAYGAALSTNPVSLLATGADNLVGRC